MTKKINEASIKVDVNGLESADFETLSRMLALAGQAESNTGSVSGPSTGGGLPPLKPMDFDSIGGSEETQPIMDPADAMAADSPADGAGDLGAAIDDLAGTVSDFGADAEEAEMGLDMDGGPSVESESDFEDEGLADEVGADDISMELDDDGEDFDMNSMSGLANMVESLFFEDDSAAEDVVDTDEEEDTDLDDAEEEAAASELDEGQILPDLSLDEDSSQDELDNAHGPYRSEAGARDDAEASVGGDFIIIPSRDGYYWKQKEADGSQMVGPYQSEAGARDDAEAKLGTLDFFIHRRPDGYYYSKNQSGGMFESADGKLNGPFQTERQAVEDGQSSTNGIEGDHFIVVPQGNAYYWKRVMQEELQNEPEPHFADTDGIENSRHNYRHKRTALGDNPLLHNVRESEEVDADNDKEDDNDDEDVEDICESLNAAYAKFIGGLNGK